MEGSLTECHLCSLETKFAGETGRECTALWIQELDGWTVTIVLVVLSVVVTRVSAIVASVFRLMLVVRVSLCIVSAYRQVESIASCGCFVNHLLPFMFRLLPFGALSLVGRWVSNLSL